MEENIKELKNKTVSGLIWRFGERILAQVISFIVSMILARILMPEQYGIVAIVTIFINIANVFVTSGLGASLVQDKNSNQEDFSTMFYAGFLLSILLYLILFFTAPFIASLYNNDLLIPLIRVMSLRMPIAAINSIQQAYVSKKMIYKKFFFSTLFGTIISAVVGIYMAIKGYGVWALVAQYLTNAIIDTIVLFITVKWKPTLEFSFERFKKLFNYSWKIMLASFIGTIFNELKGLIIGLKYTSVDLAYSNRGEHIPKLFSVNINSTLESVLFSSISKLQDNKENVKKAVKRLISINCFLIFPLLFGLAAISEPLVIVMLTDKWISIVPYLKIVCIGECFSILGTISLQSLKATGRSDILLRLEFIKKPIWLLIIIITMFISPIALCIGNTIYAIIATIINSSPNKKLFNYSLKEQLMDVFKYLFPAIIMSIIVFLIGKISVNIYILLIMQVLIGVVIYVFICKLLKLDALDYIINYFKSKKNN